jgi:hypothetical protein
MTDRELFIKALDALDWNLPVIQDYGDKEQLNIQHNALNALRERLAQPEQEPVAYRYKMPVEDDHWVYNFCQFPDDKSNPMLEPLYTTPPQLPWVGLTDEERSELWWNTDMSDMPEHDYGKAIENKLKEKNT